VAGHRARLAGASRRLKDPRLAIASFQQTLDDRSARLERAWRQTSDATRATLVQLDRRLNPLHPSARIGREKAEVALLAARLAATVRRTMAGQDKELERLAGRLDAMSPLKVLARGYAIATKKDGRAVREPGDVSPGEAISILVRSARIEAEITNVEPVASEKPVRS
jgi:exodeoxyribonuclease VII large subunit